MNAITSFFANALAWIVSALSGLAVYQMLVAFVMQLITVIVAAFGVGVLGAQVITGILIALVVIGMAVVMYGVYRAVKLLVTSVTALCKKAKERGTKSAPAKEQAKAEPTPAQEAATA